MLNSMITPNLISKSLFIEKIINKSEWRKAYASRNLFNLFKSLLLIDNVINKERNWELFQLHSLLFIIFVNFVIVLALSVSLGYISIIWIQGYGFKLPFEFQCYHALDNVVLKLSFISDDTFATENSTSQCFNKDFCWSFNRTNNNSGWWSIPNKFYQALLHWS